MLTGDLHQEYSTENLSASQLVVMDDLRHYGLLWQRKVRLRGAITGTMSDTLTEELSSVQPHETSDHPHLLRAPVTHILRPNVRPQRGLHRP